MSQPENTLLTVLPGFPGFYHSRLSAILDSEEEMEAYNRNEEQESQEYYPETYQPEELRVDYGEFIFDCVDYAAAHLEMSQDYVRAFNAHAKDYLGFDPGLTFESMSSPREYNFETDRVFCYIPIETVEKLLTIAKGEAFETFAETIRDNHSSRSGFISFYSNDPEEWRDFEIADLDHNHICTLLESVFAFYGAEDSLCDECCDDLDEWSSQTEGYAMRHMDYDKLESRVAEKRQELREELGPDNPLNAEVFIPYRCPLTLDLFEQK